MREIVFLTPELPIVVNGLEVLRCSGPIGNKAAEYLKRRVERQELVARSFLLYMKVLQDFAQKCKRKVTDVNGVPLLGENGVEKFDSCTADEAFDRTAIAEFLQEGHSPFVMRLRRQVLRHFAPYITGRKELPASLTIPLQHVTLNGKPILPCSHPTAPLNGSAADAATRDVGDQPTAGSTPAPVDISSRIPTVEEAAAIDREVDELFRSVASLRGTHTAKNVSVMRAAAVAFCRFGGAVQADLVGMTFGEVMTTVHADRRAVAAEALATVWRACRPRRRPGLRGPEKFATVEIEFESRARAPIAAWLAVRLRDGASAEDPVFVHPMTGEPATRQMIWRLVAGHPLRAPGDPESANTQSDEAQHGRATEHRESSVFLSPSRLRHVQGMKLVERYGGGEALTAALRRHLGVSGRGIAWIYARDQAAAVARDVAMLMADAADDVGMADVLR